MVSTPNTAKSERFPLPQFRLLGYASLVFGVLWFGCVATGSSFGLQYPGFVAVGIGFATLAIITLLTRVSLSSSQKLLVGMAFAVAAYIFVRATVSPIPYLARFDVFQVILYLGFYLVFALKRSLGSSMRLLRCVFLILVVGNCIVAAYQIFFDIDFHILPGVNRDRRTNGASGFYNNHAHLAGILAISLGVFLPGALSKKSGLAARAIWILPILVSLGGIAASLGRGGAVAAAVGLLSGFCLWAVLFGVRKYQLALVAISVLVALVGVGWVITQERGKGNPKTAVSVGGRSVYWKQAVRQAGVEPAFGTGSRTYPLYFEKHRPRDLYKTALLPYWAHNDYLQTLAEYGSVGLVLVSVFVLLHLGMALVWIWRLRERNSAVSLELVGIFAVCASALAHACFDFNMRLPAYGVLVSAAFGVLASAVGAFVRDDQEGHQRTAWPWISTYICILLFCLGGAAIFSALKFGPVDAVFRSAEAKVRAGRGGAALGDLHHVVETDPQNYGAWLNLGMLRYQEALSEDLPLPLVLEYLNMATNAFEQGLEANPYDHYGFALTAECFLMKALGTSDEAERAAHIWRSEHSLEQAIEWAPLQPRAFAIRGDIELNRALDYADSQSADLSLTERDRQMTKYLSRASDAYVEAFLRTAKVKKRGSRGARGRSQVRELLAKYGLTQEVK